MWIIPKPLHTSAYVQDMVALTLGSGELSELCEQSLLVRSKPLPVRTWSQRLKRAGSMPHLSGRILKPSLMRSFAEKWTYYQGASLVSHSHQQADEQETTTQDTSGRTSSKVSNDWADPPLFSSKMLRGSSAQSSRAMGGPTQQVRPFCSMSSESWSAWVIKRRQAYSQRVKSVRPISENECLLWVCAPISATQDALLFQRCSAPQSEEMWGTPRIGAAKAPSGGGDPSKKEHKYRIENQAQPTQPQEAQSSTIGSRQESQWATPDKGKLNPRWVETLMGLPVGWVMPSCANLWTTERTSYACSEMESYQRQQSVPFVSCGAK